MNRWRIQFKLSFLFSLAIAVSVVVAFFTNPSFLTLAVMMIGSIGFTLFNFPRYRKVPALVGGAVGVLMVTMPIGLLILYTVIEAPRDQGQLYYEDGPVAFFVILFIVWFVGSLLAAAVGMLVGSVIGGFVWLVDSASSNQG